MGILRTALRKVEASINESEDHLEESRMREEEAHQEDRGESDSSEEQDRDVIVEGAQESGPTSAEATDPPIPMANIHKQSPLWRWTWVTSHRLLPRMQQRSCPRRMRCSQVIPPQWLERWPGYRSPLLKAMSPRMVKPHNRSHPPLCVNEVLHMSPLTSVQGAQHEPSE